MRGERQRNATAAEMTDTFRLRSGMAPKFTALVADIRKGDQGRIFQDVEAQVSSNPMRGKNVNGEV